MNNSSFFESTFLYVYVILVIVEFCAFLLLWRLNWRAWWQFCLMGAVLGCCVPVSHRIAYTVIADKSVSFITRWDPTSSTLLLIFIFGVWAGLEILFIRWVCGITSADSTQTTPLKLDTMKNFPQNYFPARVKEPLTRLLLAVLITPLVGAFVPTFLFVAVIFGDLM